MSAEPTARERIANLWDRAVPVGPLLDAFAAEVRAKAYREAADDAERFKGAWPIVANWLRARADVISPPAEPRRNGMDPRLILGIAPDWPATDANVISKEQQ